ncbi:MAG: cytochrome c-type biogenesis protein CcmH, partial [Gammaproteobacteria bacterium]|nr:cytochrome c-type biogenesis protein CcmH [Gammaproteobacteria bacterium]
RYGDFVLYQPPVQPNTWLLWGGPFLLLLIALLVFAFILRRRAHMDAVDGEEGT